MPDRKTGFGIRTPGIEAGLLKRDYKAYFIELLLLSRALNWGLPLHPHQLESGSTEINIQLSVSVPTFGKIPWLSEASLINKPLVLSIPKRYPHASATFLISSKKDRNLPILFQVPDVLSKARRIQSNPMLIRNKQLCSTCQEIKMVQPRTMIIPHNLKLSFENFMNHRTMSLPPPKAQTVSKCSHNDISTESIHYRLPILGPRTAVFHGLLADTYATLQDTQLSSLPRKEPKGKTMRQ
ncbi:uncharacterized protein C1orf105 homolog [Leptonychotes weddellii]|uniref:Uncharacterized protein C1orf105 homolog n=1 Tax=Leptonychotes weddellii TaxID=9713 RepID=A0A7F8R544_LEPWE|nr:uncharacterized protein C1orf105 homolog [Leptonychotes weddellii]